MSQKKLGGILAAATVTTLSFSVVAAAGSYPTKQSNAGDSISQGFDADDIPSDHPSYSWVQGTNSGIDSVFTRYQKLVPGFQQQAESVTGAEMIAGGDNFPAQATRICGQSTLPQHVSVLLGANDICNAASSSSSDPTANMYSTETYTAAFDAGMEELESCLPAGATIEVLSVPGAPPSGASPASAASSPARATPPAARRSALPSTPTTRRCRSTSTPGTATPTA